MSEETKEEKKLTPEQMEDRRKKLIDYYKKQNELLEFQAKHESLMTEIEMSRAKRMEMIIRQAQMAAGPGDNDPDPDNTKDPERGTPTPQEVAPDGETKLRPLKKVE